MFKPLRVLIVVLAIVSALIGIAALVVCAGIVNQTHNDELIHGAIAAGCGVGAGLLLSWIAVVGISIALEYDRDL